MTEFDSILLVDDHPLFRNGLISLIHDAFPDTHIREFGSINEARTGLERESPSIAILDVTLPDGDGVSFAGDILAVVPECRIYILTMHRRRGLMIRARDAGCRGYFLKEGDGSAIIDALKVNDKQFRVSSQMKNILNEADDFNTARKYADLTRREREVFRLFAEGLGYKEVAWRLGISPRTASVHRYNIFHKLDINSDVELVKAAVELGLII